MRLKKQLLKNTLHFLLSFIFNSWILKMLKESGYCLLKSQSYKPGKVSLSVQAIPVPIPFFLVDCFSFPLPCQSKIFLF